MEPIVSYDYIENRNSLEVQIDTGIEIQYKHWNKEKILSQKSRSGVMNICS